MKKIIALGEILIDFTPLMTGNKPAFQQNAGGAPANVLACASKFDIQTVFIGCVGNDVFGKFLIDFLKQCHINSSHVKVSAEYHTTLAFITLKEDGDREFTFYRKHGADKMLKPEDIDEGIFEPGDVFHIGSLSMTDEPAKSATLKSLRLAKEKGCLISYDPNLRPALWNNVNTAYETILSVMDCVDILKVSEEELFFLTKITDIDAASEDLFQRYRIPLILVTLGKNGCAFRYQGEFHHINAFSVKAVDTTGAGDSHLGAMLYQILHEESSLEKISIPQMKELVTFANKTAAIVSTRYGSAEIMPTLGEILSADLT